MKMLIRVLTVLVLSTGAAMAQDLSGNANNSVSGVSGHSDVNGFNAPATLGPQSSKGFRNAPNLHPNLQPQLGGVFVDGGKYGTQLINPAAPASYGMGAKYLTAPSSRSDLQHESGRAAHRDAGGIKLFSFEF